MRLTELEPSFRRYEERIEMITRLRAGVDPYKFQTTPFEEADFETVLGPQGYYVSVATLDEAHGIRFGCPLCFHGQVPGQVARAHNVLIGFAERAPPGTFSRNDQGQDSRWAVSGTGFEDLTLTPSIWNDKSGAAQGRCSWHGFITNGVIVHA